ncbi:MAG: preprotein translocase subunit YajC [Alphaproteobacteria bacterium]|nr:preprotein translocase subunit YajC [Alphaproteobacteria bacterium]
MNESLLQIMPLLLIFIIFYFLLLRPQQKRMKEHRDLIRALRRGDTVVLSGGIIAKIVRIRDDNEVEAEISENTRVRIVRDMIMEVRIKGEPVQE